MITDELRRAPKKEKRIFLYVLGAIAFTVIIIFIFFRFESFFSIFNVIINAVMPFLSGLIVAFILNAFVNLFENIIFKPLNIRFEEGRIWNRIRRPITLVLSYLVLFAVVSVIIFYIIPELIKSGELFAENASKTLPGYINNISSWFSGVMASFNLDPDINNVLNKFFQSFNWANMLENATKFTSDIFGGLLSATMNVASGVFTVIMSFIYSAYFLSGKEGLIKTAKKLLYAFTSRRTANRVSTFFAVSNNIFSCYVRGQLTECVILGSLCYIGMSIIGLDYALLISVILTISALVPLLGAYIGAFLGAIILLMVHPIDALWFLIFIVCLQQFEGNVIYPRVVGSSMGLPGIWTLTAVMVFGSLFGILGIIIGTPTAAVTYRLVKYRTHHRLESKGVDENIINGSEINDKYNEIMTLHPSGGEEPGAMRKQYRFSEVFSNFIDKFKSKTKH